MTDIVKWLREQAANDFTCEAKLIEAADKIEHLRQVRVDLDVKIHHMNVEFIRLENEANNAKAGQRWTERKHNMLKASMERMKTRLKKAAQYEKAEAVLTRLMGAVNEVEKRMNDRD
jgi:hypothetical protein